MTYNVSVRDSINFCRAEKAFIKNYKWGTGYEPQAYAQLIYVKDKGFALKMVCAEKEPKTVYGKYGDPVYKDSCMEFFVSFNNDSPKYMNFEMNSVGAFLSAVRSDRKNKTPIDVLAPLPEVKAVKGKGEWSVSVFFSLVFIEKTFGVSSFSSGDTFKGNFYKCGDETETPHFGMWAPVDLPSPDFHRPEFFGEFIIK